MQFQTPKWVKHAVFYQIFPDRFRRSPRLKHDRGIQFKPWGANPAEQGFQGGDLLGIVDSLDMLQELGINALYLNPIFSAAHNHRYNTYDYLQVDPLLGGDAALRELLDEAHHQGMRIILDGVFNHCGRGFWAFHHILENKHASPYLDWFFIQGQPLVAYSQDRWQQTNYTSWKGVPSLPKFNTSNPGVRDYLFKVVRYWLDFGIDGWRLDAPEEITDDTFWRELRQQVKSAHPDAYIVGEIWPEARHWLQGDMFDAVMNYVITGPLLSFFGGDNLNRSWKNKDVKLEPLSGHGFSHAIREMFELYDWQVHYAQLNMLDSHDMPRALWLLNNDKQAFSQAVFCQMTMPGAPCVYYGDEIGLSAGTDPLCRGAFPWDAPSTWDHDLRELYKNAIRIRHRYPSLRTGDFTFLHSGEKTVAYRRKLGSEETIIAFNAGSSPQDIALDRSPRNGKAYTQVWPAAETPGFTETDQQLMLHIPSRGVVILASES